MNHLGGTRSARGPVHRPTTPTTSLTPTYDPSTLVLTLAGEIDESALHQLEHALLRWVVAGPARHVDLTAVTFLPCSAISCLVRCLDDAGARRLVRLRAAHGTIAGRVLGVLGIDHDPSPALDVGDPRHLRLARPRRPPRLTPVRAQPHPQE